MTLTAEELHTIKGALNVAEIQYRKDADIPHMRPRMVAQFLQQADDCAHLLERIDLDG